MRLALGTEEREEDMRHHSCLERGGRRHRARSGRHSWITIAAAELHICPEREVGHHICLEKGAEHLIYHHMVEELPTCPEMVEELRTISSHLPLVIKGPLTTITVRKSR